MGLNLHSRGDLRIHLSLYFICISNLVGVVTFSRYSNRSDKVPELPIDNNRPGSIGRYRIDYRYFQLNGPLCDYTIRPLQNGGFKKEGQVYCSIS